MMASLFNCLEGFLTGAAAGFCVAEYVWAGGCEMLLGEAASVALGSLAAGAVEESVALGLTRKVARS